MRVTQAFPPLDFLPTLAQWRRREMRRQWRVWVCLAACGAMASLVPIAWDRHQRRDMQAQQTALRATKDRLAGEVAAFDMTRRQLAQLRAHRRTVVALVERRPAAADRLLDIMRACADGVRLSVVKMADAHLRIEGYATTQSRVRETQKRLRALPWVRKVTEVESSVVPESVRRQWADAQTQAGALNIRRFTLRIALKPVPAPVVFAGVSDLDGQTTEEVPDVR
ncbi:PilN domain-containing protein [Pandoraea commovens]|uniref:PilN domain-containing protein n=1 Tax=Pandoraea commovens TaxID=2508289 RepID=A0ABY5QEK0_9BURK|nr:PilN domain-containing protein [Pandoraea commovens]UVA79196.1 PilN domain-containing protein [Pandoraea commovens]